MFNEKQNHDKYCILLSRYYNDIFILNDKLTFNLSTLCNYIRAQNI